MHVLHVRRFNKGLEAIWLRLTGEGFGGEDDEALSPDETELLLWSGWGLQ